MPFLGVDTERDFHPVVFSFHQTYEADKIRSFYLSTGRARIHTQGTWMSLHRENHVDIICLPPHNSHKMQPLDKAFMGPLKTFYCEDIEKWLHSHPGQVIIYQTGKQFGNAYKRAATGEIVANGFQATPLSLLQ